MPDLRLEVAHTADLSRSQLEAGRALMYAAFDDATDDDWEHGLGGMHAMVWEAGELLAHGSVIQRRLLYQGRPLRTGYVEVVAVHPRRKRQGLGSMVMAELERIIVNAYEIGALGASEEGIPFYLARGWKPWQGQSYALTPGGVIRTPEDDDGIFVLPAGIEVDVTADLTCDYRRGELW